MPAHPTDSWFEGMDRSDLFAWASNHAAWSEDVWASGDAEAWSSAFANDVIGHVRRRMGPESYQGIADLVEIGWGLHDFFPIETVELVDVVPPAAAAYRIEMRDESANVVGIYIVHSLDRSGRVAEFVVYDDDASLATVQQGMASLAGRSRS